ALPGARVARQGLGQPARGRLREVEQDGAQPFRLGGGAFQEAAGLASVGVVADVLVGPAGQPLLEQELAVVPLRPTKGAGGVVNRLAALQQLFQSSYEGDGGTGRAGVGRHGECLLVPTCSGGRGRRGKFKKGCLVLFRREGIRSSTGRVIHGN